MNLLSVEHAVTFYDLTNTYCDGAADEQEKAQRGHSTEKRSDRPLLTLAVVLDGSGFVRRSAVFAGNVREDRTLQTMMKRLKALQGACVVMDRGVAGEKQIAWLRDNGYRYLVVSRDRKRAFDTDASTKIKTASGHKVRLHKVVSEDGKEVRLYCWSQDREKKERFATRFETALTKLSEGLMRPRTQASGAHSRAHRTAQSAMPRHRELLRDRRDRRRQEGTAVDVRWKRKQKDGSMMALPGVNCLRSNDVGSDVEALWRTYARLTDLEAVFCSLKSELGLRRIYHSKAERADGHVFITVIAYQTAQVIRRTLKEHGITASSATLWKATGGQMPTTTTFLHRDGRTLPVRKTNASEGLQRAIHAALGVAMKAGGLRKTTIGGGLEIHFEAECSATRRFFADPTSRKISGLF